MNGNLSFHRAPLKDKPDSELFLIDTVGDEKRMYKLWTLQLRDSRSFSTSKTNTQDKKATHLNPYPLSTFSRTSRVF